MIYMKEFFLKKCYLHKQKKIQYTIPISYFQYAFYSRMSRNVEPYCH